MANLFQGKDLAEVYAQSRSSAPPELVKRVLIVSFLRDQVNGNLLWMLAVVLGSGQNTFLYSEHFENVIGTDVSLSQVEVASGRNNKQNVTFKVHPSHIIPALDGSLQLITAATAAHWFDLPKLSSLQKIKIKRLADCYDTERRAIARDTYRCILIPMRDLTREFDFINNYRISLQNLGARLQSSSGFQAFCQVNGKDKGEQVIQEYFHCMYNLLGDKYKEMSPNEIFLDATDTWFVVMARK